MVRLVVMDTNEDKAYFVYLIESKLKYLNGQKALLSQNDPDAVGNIDDIDAQIAALSSKLETI
jgi:hypothetical protein